MSWAKELALEMSHSVWSLAIMKVNHGYFSFPNKKAAFFTTQRAPVPIDTLVGNELMLSLLWCWPPYRGCATATPLLFSREKLFLHLPCYDHWSHFPEMLTLRKIEVLFPCPLLILLVSNKTQVSIFNLYLQLLFIFKFYVNSFLKIYQWYRVENIRQNYKVGGTSL